MIKKIGLALLFTLVFALSGCTKKAEPAMENSDKIKVVVSFNAIKEFVDAIGKDRVNTVVIVPKGVETHDFEPKARDMEGISKADIFVYNGLGMESWVEGTLKSINNKNLTIVDSSKGAKLIKIKDHEEEEHKEKDHDHGEYDPHIWLSLIEAQTQALNIKDALVQVDQENKQYYEDNYKEFSDKLQTLYKEYESKFNSLENKNFVTGHAAFAYLCRDFNLKQSSIESVFGEGEATASTIKSLVDYCKTNNIKTIFMEEMASPKVSETLAKEVGGKVEVINTLENQGRYIDTMRENLEKIFNSLK